MYQRIGKAAYKPDFVNMIRLMELADNPHRTFRSVHIAGTNGKGSVTHMLSSVLYEAGYKTGMFTSPHLRDFRERVKVNGKMIKKGAVNLFVENNIKELERIKPSFFEMTAAMAFHYFHEKKVDIAVIETGMGGRLDSTNIIQPMLSVITNIGRDHTRFLGNSPEQIAYEKAGIIKKKVPVVIGESRDKIDEVFIKRAKELDCPLYFADKRFTIEILSTDIKDREIFNVFQEGEKVYEGLETEMYGNYQRKNIITVIQGIEILKQLGFIIKNEHVKRGFLKVVRNTGFYGRWQVMAYHPKVICDTAHNEEGLKEVVNQINKMTYGKLHFIFGMVEDKDVSDMLRVLPGDACYYFTKATVLRALDEQVLSEKAHKTGLSGEAYSSVKQALKAALRNAGKEDLVVISGSSFVVAEVIR